MNGESEIPAVEKDRMGDFHVNYLQQPLLANGNVDAERVDVSLLRPASFDVIVGWVIHMESGLGTRILPVDGYFACCDCFQHVAL